MLIHFVSTADICLLQSKSLGVLSFHLHLLYIGDAHLSEKVIFTHNGYVQSFASLGSHPPEEKKSLKQDKN